MLNGLRSLLLKFLVSPLKYLLDRSPAKAAIELDIHRHVQIHNRSQSGDPVFEKLMWLWYAENLEEFRHLFYFRIGSPSRFLEKFLLALLKKLYRPRYTMTISSPSVGPGLVIMHGVGTVIEAEKIGENCLIFQDVTIGYKNEIDDRPTIGNYVHISVGARVLGKITIGDHAVIAANTVVTKDMSPNSLAVGIPARIIKDAGNRSEYIARGIISA
jgi:serine O-acetyltransferase